MGPLPDDWQLSPTGTPVLPEFEGASSSFLIDFWEEVNSSDKERDFQTAVNASIQSALLELAQQEAEDSNSLEAMAAIVKVVSDDNQKPELPTGSDKRYSSTQKGKNVLCTSEQWEFLKTFMTGCADTRKPSVLPDGMSQARASLRHYARLVQQSSSVNYPRSLRMDGFRHPREAESICHLVVVLYRAQAPLIVLICPMAVLQNIIVTVCQNQIVPNTRNSVHPRNTTTRSRRM